MNGNGANGVVDLEPPLDPIVQLVGNVDADTANEEGLDRMVKIVAGRRGDDAGEAARIGPERISLRDEIATIRPPDNDIRKLKVMPLKVVGVR